VTPRYLIAFLVLGHGFIYVRIGPTATRTVKGWGGRSWLLGEAITGEYLASVVATLHVLAGVLILACAAAIAVGPSLDEWWPRLAVTGGVVGIAAFAVFWDGQAHLLFEEGAVGALLSLLLLASAFACPRALA
jgi:uncharacterized membrane protein YjdF